MLGIETEQNRIFGLDFLRAIAIFFVVHGHGAFLLNDTHFAFFNKTPFPDVVDIFFVLTGFLIGSSFLSYAKKNNGVDIRKTLWFYARSALRILPCYFVILFAYIMLVQGQLVHGDLHKFPMWRFATFTQNLFTPFYDFYWESWCLPVQWWFYIIFPLLLTIFSKKVEARCLTPLICLGFILFSILFRISVSDQATEWFWWDVWIRKTVASRCDAIFIGVMVAWVQLYAPVVWQRHSLKFLLAGLVLLVVVVSVPQQPGTLYKNVFSCTIQSVAFAMLLPSAAKLSQSRTSFEGIITHVSVLSYSMYLINLMIVQLIVANFSETAKQWGAWSYVIYWIAVIVLSYLLYILVEKPFMKLRKRVTFVSPQISQRP